MDDGTKPYCTARSKLPTAPLTLVRGRPVKIVDGTLLRLADTPANRQACPSAKNQFAKPTIPLLKLLALFSAASGAIPARRVGAGQSNELRLLLGLHFTFLAERYGRRSVMITSNLVFSKGDQLFKDPLTTLAAIDRLVHHATILEFDGASVRAQKAKARQSA